MRGNHGPPPPTTCPVCGGPLWNINGWEACPEPGHTKITGRVAPGEKIVRSGMLPTKTEFETYADSFEEPR